MQASHACLIAALAESPAQPSRAEPASNSGWSTVPASTANPSKFCILEFLHHNVRVRGAEIVHYVTHMQKKMWPCDHADNVGIHIHYVRPRADYRSVMNSSIRASAESWCKGRHASHPPEMSMYSQIHVFNKHANLFVNSRTCCCQHPKLASVRRPPAFFSGQDGSGAGHASARCLVQARPSPGGVATPGHTPVAPLWLHPSAGTEVRVVRQLVVFA